MYFIRFLFLTYFSTVILFAGSVTVQDNVSTPISDNSCFTKTFDVAVNGTVYETVMEVNIDHTWRGDLTVSLTSPAGTVIDLTSNNGRSADNLYVEFLDSATTSIVDDTTTHTVTVQRSPEQSLSALNNETIQGTWSLEVCDTANGDTGTYNYAILTLYYDDLNIPPKVSPIPDQPTIINLQYTFDASSYVSSTNGNPILSYRLDGALPAGLNFDTATGVISGTPTVEEVAVVTLYATDVDGESSGESFAIKVLPRSPIVDYHMDECFVFNGTGGVIGDVKDSSSYQKDATSEGAVNIVSNVANPPVCNYVSTAATGDRIRVEDASVPDGLSTQLSVSAWLYPTTGTPVDWVAAVMKTSTENWTDGFGLANNTSDNTNIKFFVNGRDNSAIAPLDMDTWNHIVGVYDGTNIKIYKNGTEVASVAYSTALTTVNEALFIGNDLADQYDDKWLGSIDEVEVWNVALSATEVSSLYNNQLSGNNYDGSSRTCTTCGATITGGTWEQIGLPADLRVGSHTLNTTIADNMPGTYGTDWIVFRRDYSDTNNSSWYSALTLSDPVEFGKGYWLGSKIDGSWDINDVPSVDYNATVSECPASQCVLIPLKSASLNSEAVPPDDLNGTGSTRYNLSGFIGKTPVSWADCRFVVSDLNGSNKEVLTPSGAQGAGYASKDIWIYNPSSRSYSVCDDTLGSCQLLPYRGFWIELRGPTKNKIVQLLVPKE